MTALHYRLLTAHHGDPALGVHPDGPRLGEPPVWPLALGAEVACTPPDHGGSLGALLERGGGDVLVAYQRYLRTGQDRSDLLRVEAVGSVTPGHWVWVAMDAARDVRALLPRPLAEMLDEPPDHDALGEAQSRLANWQLSTSAAPSEGRRHALRAYVAALAALRADQRGEGSSAVALLAADAWRARECAFWAALGAPTSAFRGHLLTGVDALAWRVLLQTPPRHLTLAPYGGAP